MKLAVAFLCYNQSSSPYLPEFLASLEKSLLGSADDILVLAGDNSDQAPYENRDLIAQHNQSSPFPARLIAFEKNLGFAAAYNRLFKIAIAEGCDCFLMLNPDMQIEPGAIKKLSDALTFRPDLAAVCPKIYRWDFINHRHTKTIDSCGIVMKPGLRFVDLGQGKEDDGSFDHAEIIGPSGAAALFNLSQLIKVAERDRIFDENFFMYKEDCDLAYRMRLKGLLTSLVPGAIFYHDRTAAAQDRRRDTLKDWQQRSRQTRVWSFVNQHLIFLKHLTSEPIYSKLLILGEIAFYFIFSLILAPFLLKSYPIIWRQWRRLD